MNQLAQSSALLGGFVLTLLFTLPIQVENYPHPFLAYYQLTSMVIVLGMNLVNLSINTLIPYYANRMLAYTSNPTLVDKFLMESANLRKYSVFISSYSLPILLSTLLVRLYATSSKNVAIAGTLLLLGIIAFMVMKKKPVAPKEVSPPA